VEAIMLEHKFALKTFAAKSHRAFSNRLVVPNAIAGSTMLLFLTRDGSAFAQEIDPAAAIRGSLGVSLASLGVDSRFGALSFFLNGGFALLCGAIAVFLVARSRRNWKATFGRQPMSFSFLLPAKRAGAEDRQTGLMKRGLGG
jgi:hypothetical protein